MFNTFGRSCWVGYVELCRLDHDAVNFRIHANVSEESAACIFIILLLNLCTTTCCVKARGQEIFIT